MEFCPEPRLEPPDFTPEQEEKQARRQLCQDIYDAIGAEMDSFYGKKKDSPDDTYRMLMHIRTSLSSYMVEELQ